MPSRPALGTTSDSTSASSLFHCCLLDGCWELPECVRDAQLVNTERVLIGAASVNRGSTFPARVNIHVVDQTMNLPVIKGWFPGVSISLMFLPLSLSKEFDENNRMHFDVRYELPFSLGLLVQYQGQLSDLQL